MSSDSSNPTIVTDSLNYAPGSDALISAKGFDPGATIEFEVRTETVAPDGTSSFGNPSTLFATVGADGTLSTNFYLNSIYAGTTLSVTATEVQIGADGSVTPVSSVATAASTITVGAASSTLPAPTVTTDKGDYAPGSTANITASGFGSGDAITFAVDTIDATTGAVLWTGPTWTASADSSGTAVTPFSVTPNYANTTIELVATDAANGESASTVFTDAATLGGIKVEKLVSVDGGANWYVANDTGDYSGFSNDIAFLNSISGVTGIASAHLHDDASPPVMATNGTVTYEVVVTNTNAASSGVSFTGVTVTDSPGGPAFTVGSTLLAGASEVSNQVTVAAVSGTQTDTVTVSGTAFGNTFTDRDSVTYIGGTPGITIDKQISTDGTNWVDVGNGNLAQDPNLFVGSTVYEQVVVTNTGSTALSGLSVSNVNGPSFTLGSTTLGVGGSETSSVSTFNAVSGYQLDTATVTGTGGGAPVSASDSANYTGVTAGITIDKQISTDGTNWVDVGNGNLAQDPNLFVGSTVYEQVVVTNTGSTALSGLSVSNVNGPSFTLGSTTLGVGGSETSQVATLTAVSGQQIDTATVSGTATDDAGNTQPVSATDQANYTGVTAGITIDKQISVDGSHWLDVGNGNLADDPSLFVGSTVYEQVVVTNTGSTALSGLSVSNVNGPSFTLGSTTLGVGGSETSQVATLTAVSGQQIDTATVSGTATDDAGNTQPLSATDQANYTGVTAGITIDKQISVDGSHWLDVGTGNLADDPSLFVGSTVYEQVVVTNTGSTALSGLSVSNVNGPSFTLGSTTLGVGGSETSQVATLTAVSGQQIDTATVSGTATDDAGNTQPVSATDQANYTGVTAGITIDKQISTDGTTWVDVGNGVLNDPIVALGSSVYERVIVTNEGATALSGLTVTDVGGNGPPSFTLGSTTLAVGASETSAVATINAASGHQLDTATVNGSATDGVGNTQPVTASDQADYTGVTGSIALDKQISTDGTHWLDAGNGNLADDPRLFVGKSVYEQVIVSNTGAIALSGLTVTDVGGNGPPSFTLGSTTLAAGASETSAVATISAASGYQLDTATVNGTAGGTQPVSASDSANYTGVTAGVAIDKQISVDGSTWVDVGNGNLADDPSLFVGNTVYERVIVANTGSTALSGLTVTDIGGNGPPSFTVGSTLGAGQSETSAVATISAALGYQLDTATVNGTATDGVGDTKSVTASDQANYTGVGPSITIDKQISVDGGKTWLDVGNGNLADDPTVLVGNGNCSPTTVEYRVLVKNTSGINETSVSVTDVNGPAFTFGGLSTTSIAAGATATSDVSTAKAVAGYQLDTATVHGTGGGTTVTASDQANYTGVTAGISIDKQISVDGGKTWLDVGNGNLADDPVVLAGSGGCSSTGATVEYRVLLKNTSVSGINETGVSVTDVNGPAFTFGGLSTTSLAAGATVTSDVSTTKAVAGYQLDTATAKGTAHDASGNTASVSASDQANYTGVTAGVTVDKQVAVHQANSSTDVWYDVGAGTNNLPAVMAGEQLDFRILVTNTSTGGLSETISATDAASTAGLNGVNFTFGSGASTTDTLAAGGSAYSNILTTSAVAGCQWDTATATGVVHDAGGNSTTTTAKDTAYYDALDLASALTKRAIGRTTSRNGTSLAGRGAAPTAGARRRVEANCCLGTSTMMASPTI